MQVKNYQEELVLNTIDLVLQDRADVKPDELLIHDVAAYTLNRIPPKYIMSERGFTRLASEYWLDNGNESGLTSLVELVLLINRAIDVVTSRRQGGGPKVVIQAQPTEMPDIEEIEYWHNFPQIIGKVVDKKSKKPVYGICVTLYINGEKAEPAEAGWQNPYHTNFGTKGFYSFWPRPFTSPDDSSESSVRVTFEHPDYTDSISEQVIETKGDFGPHNYIKVESIFNLGTQYIAHK
jgi:competence protein ComFB